MNPEDNGMAHLRRWATADADIDQADASPHINLVDAKHHIERSGPGLHDSHPRPAAHAVRPITVMVASDRHAVLGAWMHRLAHESDIELHDAPLVDPALVACSVERHLPSVLLLDKALLDRMGDAGLRRLRECGANTRVLLLWDELSDDVVADVVRHRFHGCVLMSCSPDDCLKAIRAIDRGELWLSRAALAGAMAEWWSAPSRIDARQPVRSARGGTTLTQREAQIVELLRSGCTNKEIAHRMGVMEDTVKKHLQSVFGKLGVHRRALVALLPHAAALNRP